MNSVDIGIVFFFYWHLVGPKPPSPPSAEPETVAPETQSPTQKPTAAPKPTQPTGGGPTGKLRYKVAKPIKLLASEGPVCLQPRFQGLSSEREEERPWKRDWFA